MPHEFPHGIGAYRFHKCRCDVCREAQRETYVRYEERIAQDPVRLAARRARLRSAYSKNAERNREYARKWDAKNREKSRNRHALYNVQNRDYIGSKGKQRYEARKQSVDVKRSGRWSVAEDAIATRNDLTVLEIAILLQRSYMSVSKRRSLLSGGSGKRTDHLTKIRDKAEKCGAAWTAAEDQMIISGGVAGIEDLAVTLVRSYGSVVRRRQYLMALTPGPGQEGIYMEIVERSHEGQTSKEIQSALNVSAVTIICARRWGGFDGYKRRTARQLRNVENAIAGIREARERERESRICEWLSTAQDWDALLVVATEWNVTPKTARGFLKKYGCPTPDGRLLGMGGKRCGTACECGRHSAVK